MTTGHGQLGPVAPAPRRLLLLGGGHAQLQVLARLAAQPLPGWRVDLVTPFARQIYSGMLPGWVAGHYPIEDCAIALDALAARAGVQLHLTTGTHLDLSRNRLACADGRILGFDRLAIDTGAVAALAGLPGAAEHAQPIRPIEDFIAAWPALVQRLRRPRSGGFRLVILGAGAAGVELALALWHRARHDGWPALHIHLVGADPLPLPGAATRLRRRLLALLKQRDIGWSGGRRARLVDAGRLRLDDGSALPFDHCLVANGAAAPAWAAASGLATDAQGFIRVDRQLRSVSHPQVFAAGDVAAHADARPKSGVFAVRAGPVLAHNLRASCLDQPLQAWTPQRRALYLISTGDRHALATWGGWGWRGDWVWRWKDHIDRSFMRRWRTGA